MWELFVLCFFFKEKTTTPPPPHAVGAAQDPMKYRHVTGLGRSARALVYLLVHHARAAGFVHVPLTFIYYTAAFDAARTLVCFSSLSLTLIR